jgi:ADP-ribosyl-[dinitrogen reductase] hydrolase
MKEIQRFRGCLLGLACGDAMGTTVEFKPPGTFPEVTDMTGGGPFNLKPGEWTDDTSMALCLATSLVETGGFDPVDQMNRYVRWMDQGYLSSNGRCFDIGMTVSSALRRFKMSRDPYSGSTDPYSAGNGCIMRLAPVPMFFYPDLEAAIHHSGESSRTTHGAAQCVEASRLFGAMLFRALAGEDKEAIQFGASFAGANTLKLSAPLEAIAEGQYRSKSRSQIKGSGYVVESLEAALWCFDRSSTFQEAILLATNLGHDADTTAAICGQLAGAYYGESGIPLEWRRRVVMHNQIVELAEMLHHAAYQDE